MVTPGVLHDIRVLDFGRYISAPYCGMMLADMGAEVIRVERPGGEEDRRIGLQAVNGENFIYPGLARNKRAITLKVETPEGREVLADLVAHCDVLLHNYSPAAAERMGLTYEDIRSMRPDIIYTGISCYGANGPLRNQSGFDPIAQVCSGAAALTGFEHEVPMRSGVPWVDYSTGLCAALGTVLALRHRDACGEGQAVECSLLQTAVSYTAPMIAEAIVAQRQRPRIGNRAPYLGPSDLFKCRDGYIYVAVVTEGMWRSMMTLIGSPELIDSPELRTDLQRFEKRALVDPLVATWMAQRKVEEILPALEKARIPCGVYRTTAEVPQDPQVRECGMLQYLDLQTPGLERVPATGLAVRLSKTPGSIISRPPRIAEHNHEIYDGLLGYSEERIENLRAAGVI
jgi:crotonobetainyl-CoA:carnitine CoA-transferase CaiB-like acyl-CoA transferase